MKKKLIREKNKPEAKSKTIPAKIRKPTPKIEIVLVEDTENHKELTEKPELKIVQEEDTKKAEVKIFQEEDTEKPVKIVIQEEKKKEEMNELRKHLLKKIDLV